MPVRRTVLAAARILAAALALAACEPVAAGADAGPVRLDTPGGRVELPGAAERVVALDWTLAENLVALGVPPVGVADAAGYRTAVTVAPLPDGVADVGPAQQPDVTAVAALRPDLIVGVDGRHARLRAALEEVAPTLLLEVGPAGDGGTALEVMRATLRTLGRAVDRREDAERLLVELDVAVAAARDVLGRLPHDDVVLVQGPVAGVPPAPQVLTGGSLAVRVLAAAGLQHSREEGVPVLYAGDDSPAGAVPLGDTWLLGGAASMRRLVDRTAARLAA